MTYAAQYPATCEILVWVRPEHPSNRVSQPQWSHRKDLAAHVSCAQHTQWTSRTVRTTIPVDGKAHMGSFLVGAERRLRRIEAHVVSLAV